MVIKQRMAIMWLSHVFRQICVKVWNLREDLVVTLSFLEKEFHPTSFNIMIHLLHVVDELEICGLSLLLDVPNGTNDEGPQGICS
jgi:hypothetical protein